MNRAGRPYVGTSKDGYTLLELLVALILMAAIATMMATVVVQLRPLKRIEAGYALQASADTIADIVARDVASALALPLLDTESETQRFLIGSADQIRFVAVVRTGFQSEGLRDVAYGLKTLPNGTKVLIRSSTPRRLSDRSNLTAQDEVFWPLQALAFRYLHRSADGTVSWQDVWDNPSGLPVAVSIEATVGSKAGWRQATRVVRLGPAGADVRQ